jgi:alpha-tubulin suppressor-like RCC1 family protein
VWTSGSNLLGQLGDGSTFGRLMPVQVVGISTAKAAVAGGGHTLVLKADGTLAAWGDNRSGALGNGRPVLQTGPKAIAGARLW